MGRKHNCNTKIFSSILIVIVICGGFLPLIGQCSSPFFPITAYKDNFEENNTWNQEALLEKDDYTYLASSTEKINYTIEIYSNDDLYDLKLQGGITGEGLEENPYILEDLVIGTGFSGPALDIRNTDAYFVIKNCTVLNSGIHNEDAAISISGCSNIKIMNCFLDNNQRAIGLFDNSFNNIVINNTILHSNDFALNIGGAHNNQILNNILMDNDDYAMEVWQSEDNFITGNIFIGNHGGIQIESSNFTIFTENEISGSGGGEGFKLHNSNENNITRNTIIANMGGFYLYDSSSNNIIYFNIIDVNSETQAFEDENCTDNQWDNGTTGNFWGDYTAKYPDATNDGTVWDTPYEIDGEGPGIDHFPLVNLIFPDIKAPKFAYVPIDFSTDEGYSDLSISWTAVDLNPATYTIEMNETEVVAATAWTSGTAISYDIPEGLSEGNNSIIIIVSDESGNTAKDTVIFRVIDVLTYESPIGSYPWLWLSILSITSIAIIIAIQRKKHA